VIRRRGRVDKRDKSPADGIEQGRGKVLWSQAFKLSEYHLANCDGHAGRLRAKVDDRPLAAQPLDHPVRRGIPFVVEQRRDAVRHPNSDGSQV